MQPRILVKVPMRAQNLLGLARFRVHRRRSPAYSRERPLCNHRIKTKNINTPKIVDVSVRPNK